MSIIASNKWDSPSLYDKSSVSTGFSRLDRMLDGLHNGDLIVLTGGVSAGKSALALNIATNVAFKKLPVIFFTMESREEDVVYRLVSRIAKVECTKVRTGVLDEDEFWAVKRVQQKLRGSNFKLSIVSRLYRPAEMASFAAKAKEQFGGKLSLVIIDFLQFMDSNVGEWFPLEERIPEILRELKGMARTLKVPVLLVSQFDGAFKLGEKPVFPQMLYADSIKKYADVVMCVNRNNIKFNSEERHHAELYVDDRNNGNSKIFKLRFEDDFLTFQEDPGTKIT